MDKIHSLNQLKFILFFLSVVFIGCKESKVVQPKSTNKPNILFILVDDLGNHDLGATGSNFYETPNINALANQSLMFTNGYAASSVCSPSRASIMTGKFTARHGITDWIGAKSGTEWRDRNRFDKMLPAQYAQAIKSSEITISEVFKANGYNTFYAGKWHLGDEGSYPEDHGFEINKGGFHVGSPPGGYFAPWNNPKLPNKENGENLTTRLALETVDFIQSHKDKPFFAYLSFYAVHAPIQTTQEKWKKFRDKAENVGIEEKGYTMERVLPVRQVQDNPIYGGLIETMDDAVGIVLKALEANGVAENTIVVFSSDNGGVSSGDHYATSNLPLRGGKGYQWEGGLRVPFFIKVPWLNNGGKKSEVPVMHTDFYPTLLDLSNTPLLPEQHLDGISLKPLLEGEKLNINRPLYWHYPHYGNQGGNPTSIIQQNGWKLIHYWEDGHDELYKLPSTEKDELNVISTFPEIGNQMRNQLMNWLNSVSAKFPVEDPQYDKIKAAMRYQNTFNQKLPSLEKERLEILSKDFQPNENWWKSKITLD